MHCSKEQSEPRHEKTGFLPMRKQDADHDQLVADLLAFCTTLFIIVTALINSHIKVTASSILNCNFIAIKEKKQTNKKTNKKTTDCAFCS